MKTIVTWELLPKVAREVVQAAKAHFSEHLLSYSDRYLEKVVHPWMDSYIHENCLLPGSPSKADLDDFIMIEIKNGD